jgi:uncharacterized membrane protein
MRSLLWAVAGLVLGGIIHIVVILTLPAFAATRAWDRIAALDALNKPVVLPEVAQGQPNPLGLDPDLAYAVCRFDLRGGAASISGDLPEDFWSIAVYDRAGTVIYSGTNRDNASQSLNVGFFDPGQTQLLAQQKLDVDDDLDIVEVQEDDVFALVRLAPPESVMRPRYEDALRALTCGPLPANPANG